MLVVGGGGAGLASAIAAHDHGARTLVIEKMPNVGGITILAGGGLKAAKELGPAIAYLTRTQGGRVQSVPYCGNSVPMRVICRPCSSRANGCGPISSSCIAH